MNLPDYSWRDMQTAFFTIPFLGRSFGSTAIKLTAGLALSLFINFGILDIYFFLDWSAMAFVR